MHLYVLDVGISQAGLADMAPVERCQWLRIINFCIVVALSGGVSDALR
jgi:hypothetical protein